MTAWNAEMRKENGDVLEKSHNGRNRTSILEASAKKAKENGDD